jgi:hypothetical protein
LRKASSPGAVLRQLSEAERSAHRRPSLHPGESGRPALTFPRPLSFDGRASRGGQHLDLLPSLHDGGVHFVEEDGPDEVGEAAAHSVRSLRGGAKTLLKAKRKSKNALLWLFEPFEDDPRYMPRRLFSFDAAYLDGRLFLAVKDGKEPWNGLMVCTSRDRHAALIAQFPQLKSHQVLGKWLYISQIHPDFESVSHDLVLLARRRDPRLGVDPQQ